MKEYHSQNDPPSEVGVSVSQTSQEFSPHEASYGKQFSFCVHVSNSEGHITMNFYSLRYETVDFCPRSATNFQTKLEIKIDRFLYLISEVFVSWALDGSQKLRK